MSRSLFGKKKTKKIREETGLPVVAVMSRGGSNHTRMLCLDDGTITYQKKNGSLIKTTDKFDLSILERIPQ